MKIVVVGLGYVGLSNAVLLAQNNEVIGVDISQERIEKINSRVSPIEDPELRDFLKNKSLHLFATNNIKRAVDRADYVILATPTNFNEQSKTFDTSTIEALAREILDENPNTCIVIKSTVPIGFTQNLNESLKTQNIIFSPEFLREGRALEDNLNPSRIIVGEKSRKAKIFAELLSEATIGKNARILLTDPTEAEAIKLFSNTYLAMRIAYFNEIDSYSISNDFNVKDVIDGICTDPRIGEHYNNPSFGFGGYCLPKDTKQLEQNFSEIPQRIISAVVTSNQARKLYIAQQIINQRPTLVGIYRLSMKSGSDNYRESAVIDVIQTLKDHKIAVQIFEPMINDTIFNGCRINNNLLDFKKTSDLIVANRLEQEISDFSEKVYSRDVYGNN